MKSTLKKETRNTRHHQKYSILLLALLLIGFATYGTYAYFTDSKEINSNLTLTKGSVKLENPNSDGWEYIGNFTDKNPQTLAGDNPNINPKETKSDNFINVLPGDRFTSVIKVTYSGKNDADFVIPTTESKQNSNKNYKVSKVTVKSGDTVTNVTVQDNNNSEPAGNEFKGVVKPKDTITITVQADVPYNDSPENFVATSRNEEDGEFISPDKLISTIKVKQHLEGTNN